MFEIADHRLESLGLFSSEETCQLRQIGSQLRTNKNAPATAAYPVRRPSFREDCSCILRSPKWLRRRNWTRQIKQDQAEQTQGNDHVNRKERLIHARQIIRPNQPMLVK